MGYELTMTHQRTAPARRSMAVLLLATVLAGIVPWQGARAMICRMDGPVSTAPAACSSCDTGTGDADAPSLEAGSCCRFASPEEVSTLPAFTPSTHRAPAGDERVSTTLPVESHSAVATVAAVSALAASNTTHPSAPEALSTHLRL